MPANPPGFSATTCSSALLRLELRGCPSCQAIAITRQLCLSLDDYDAVRWLDRMELLQRRAHDRGNHFHLVS